MPAKKMVTKDMILCAALKLLREQGYEAVNIKGFAKALGCSTQPVYLSFSGMEELRGALVPLAVAEFARLMKAGNPDGVVRLYDMSYIRFAKEEPRLFCFLFMRPNAFSEIRQVLLPMTEPAMAELAEACHLDREAAHFLHDQLWMQAHGIAAMVATAFCNWDMDKVGRMLAESRRAFTEKYEHGDVFQPGFKNLILPLFVEQFLLMFVGIADTFVVSFSGEADVSGVSLVTSFNTVLIFLFTALSSGGAVIISQYIGSKNERAASRSAGQLLMISALISVILTGLIMGFHTRLLRLLFGKIDPEVMAACESYLLITTLSLPFLAVYDAGAALCRSIGKTNVTMNISLVANVINVIGNCVGVFALKLGAAGVAWPSLLSRVLSAAAVTVYCFRKQNPVRYVQRDILAWDGGLLKKIMGIALPNGVENGVHQLVKVVLSSMVALFGTYQIAANGVAQSIWSLAAIMGLAMAPVYTTVIGQCMGARDIDAANFYFKKLNRITLLLSVLWNALIFAVTPLIVRYSAISPEAKTLVVQLVLINNIFNGLAYPFAGPLGNGLRAAGDVKFTMLVSITLTIAARLLFSALFGLWLGWGVIGVAIGMSIDLVFRGAIFLWRQHSQKWTRFRVI